MAHQVAEVARVVRLEESSLIFLRHSICMSGVRESKVIMRRVVSMEAEQQPVIEEMKAVAVERAIFVSVPVFLIES
jgi:hypothetical protein